MEILLGFGVVGLLAIIALSVFWIIELIDVLRRDFPDPIVKIVWFVVILTSHFLGSLVYYFVGKPMGRLQSQR